MLQSMRHLAQSWFFKGLMLLLIVSFGIWGIGDMFRGNPLQRSVAKAGNATITVQDLNRSFEQGLARARQMFAPEMTAQQARQMGLLDNSLNELIEASLVDQDLQRLGIEASDRAVFDQLVKDPQFKDKDGKFDKSILQNLLSQAHISERDFLDRQRKELASRQLVSALANPPPPPHTMLETLYKARGQKRILDVVTLDTASIPAPAAPDDKALQDFYQGHPQAFTAPEMRGLTLAILSTDSFAKDITISDDQVKKEYDSKQDQLAEPEKRDLLQVVVQDEAEANKLAASARESHNLVAAAKPTGHQVVPLNGAEESTLLPEMAKPVFALKVGDVADPIKSPLGWHVIQLRKITPAGVPAFDTVKESLRDSMKRDQAADAATRAVNQMDDDIAAGHTLDEMADSLKLRLIKIPAITATGKLADGKDPADLPHKDDVLKAAFAQNSGDTSPVMDDHNGTYFAVHTDSVMPSTVKPFAQVKVEVVTAWKKTEQVKRAEAEAENIAKILRDGKPAAAVANEIGVSVRLSKPISLLGDSDSSLPKSAIAQIMSLKKGGVTVVADSGKEYILRLADIIAVADVKDATGLGKIKAAIVSDAPKELADQYLKYLRVIFPVKINQDVLDSVAQQGS